MSSIASSLRQLSQASRKKLSLGRLARRCACSTSLARTGAAPMPPRVTEARVILPPPSVSEQHRRRDDGEIAVPARELDEGVAVAAAASAESARR